VEFWEFLESKKSKNNPFWKVSENIFFFGKNILHLHYKFKTIKKNKMEKIKNKKKNAINNGAGWDINAQDMLRDLVAKGMSTKKIARVMGRTDNSITYQKGVMGLYSPNGPKIKNNLKNASNSFMNLIDLIKKSKESKEPNEVKVVKEVKSRMRRVEWSRTNLATLKRLGDDGILHKAPSIFGCTENAARIKYGRFFKKPSRVASKTVIKSTGFNPATMEIQKSVAPAVNPSNVTREHAKDITRSAREIARANGKRITMAMFFVEDL
jgi:hypothetical protein